MYHGKTVRVFILFLRFKNTTVCSQQNWVWSAFDRPLPTSCICYEVNFAEAVCAEVRTALWAVKRDEATGDHLNQKQNLLVFSVFQLIFKFGKWVTILSFFVTVSCSLFTVKVLISNRYPPQWGKQGVDQQILMGNRFHVKLRFLSSVLSSWIRFRVTNTAAALLTSLL